jgi:hypothetical protein
MEDSLTEGNANRTSCIEQFVREFGRTYKRQVYPCPAGSGADLSVRTIGVPIMTHRCISWLWEAVLFWFF